MRRDSLDRILWMEKKGSEGDVYLMMYQVAEGKNAGEKYELTAPAYQFPNSDKWLIIERRIKRRNGDIVAIPMLARQMPADEVIQGEPETFADQIRQLKKLTGTKRTGLGHR